MRLGSSMKFNLPQELLKRFYSAIIVLCTSISVWFSSATKSDLRRLWRVIQSEKKGWKKSLWTHIQQTPSLNCRRYRALSTRTTRHRNSFLPSRNPSHEHLTLNVEHTTLLYIIFHHTYLFFISNLHIADLYTHNCLYYIIVFLLLCTLPLYIILLSSVSCPVSVILLHCRASVTITNSSYV